MSFPIDFIGKLVGTPEQVADTIQDWFESGAGKTTLVKQVIGLLRPTSGSITLGRHDLVSDPAAARQLCSYLPQAQVPIDSFRRLDGGLVGRGGLGHRPPGATHLDAVH